MDETQVSGGALPTAPVEDVAQPAPATAQPNVLPSVADYAKEYTTSRKAVQEANDALMQALNKRLSGSEMSGYKAMQGFLAPTKTGSFGESLGNVAALLSEDENKSIEIAKMRAELAQRSFDQNRKMLAQGLVMDSMGVPEKTANAIVSSGGAMPIPVATSLVSSGKLNPQFILQVRQFDKETAEGLNEAFKQVVELRKLAIDERKAGVGEAEFKAKYGVGYQDLLPSGTAQPTPSGTTTTTPTSKPTGATTAPTGGKAPTGQTYAGVDVSDLAGLPLEERNKILGERIKARDKEWEGERNTVLSWKPQLVKNNIRDLEELHKIATEQPQLFGLLQKQGIIPALQTAAQEGVQVGRLGSVSLPVEKFLQGLKLSAQEKAILSRATQILGNQFFLNAKDNKSALGPSISNSDVLLMKAPMVTASDSAEAIKYWAKQNVLLNKQRGDIYEGLTGFDRSRSGGSPSAFFFSNNYNGIINKYDDLSRQLTEKYSPLYQGNQ